MWSISSFFPFLLWLFLSCCFHLLGQENFSWPPNACPQLLWPFPFFFMSFEKDRNWVLDRCFELWVKLCLKLDEQMIILFWLIQFGSDCLCYLQRECFLRISTTLSFPEAAQRVTSSIVRRSGLENVLFEKYLCFLFSFHTLLQIM